MTEGLLLFDFVTAMRVARVHRVRRKGWVDKWLRWSRGLWFLEKDGEPAHVVKTVDFGADDFFAEDWTHMTPECLTDGQEANGTKCPLPWVDDNGSGGGSSNGGGGGSNGGGGGSNGSSGGDKKQNPFEPDGGGGGGGNVKEPPETPNYDREEKLPTISFAAWVHETTIPCYYRGGGLGETRPASMSSSVILSDGDPEEVYFITVKYGGKIIVSATLKSGDKRDFVYENFQGEPGKSSFPVWGRVWGGNFPAGGGDTAWTRTLVMKPWCSDGSSSGGVGEP